MRKALLIFTAFIILLSGVFLPRAYANETLLNSCIREYSIKGGDLYLNALSAIYENKFEVLEMQSKNGLILFRAGRTDFLATVYSVKNGSGIKILPANSDFGTGIEVQNLIFKTLDGFSGTLSKDGR